MPEAIRALTMPKWGLAMEEGTVAEWDIAEGETFAAGDEIVLIETSKIAGPLEAPFEGQLTRIVAQAGDVLPVGALLAVVTDGAVASEDVDAFVAEFQSNFVPAEASESVSAASALTVEVEGRTISYVVNAPEDADGATPVLLVHGFGGDANSWLFTIGDLAQSRPVYALDLPGHGASSKDVGNGPLEMLVRTVSGFLDALAIERVHLVAHSMGGVIALSLAVDSPDRVASLSLLSACGLGDRVNHDFIQGFITAQRRKDVKPVLQQLFANPELVTREMIDDILKFKRIDGVPEALRTIAEAVFPEGVQTVQFRERLIDISPLLVIWGTEDAIVDPVGAEGLPDSVNVHLLDGVGHMPQMEASHDVNRLLRAHIDAS